MSVHSPALDSKGSIDQPIEADTRQLIDNALAALDNPPPPGPKLKALLRRTSVWQDASSTFAPSDEH